MGEYEWSDDGGGGRDEATGRGVGVGAVTVTEAVAAAIVDNAVRCSDREWQIPVTC